MKSELTTNKDEIFDLIFKAQAEYEELNELKELGDLFSEPVYEDYSQRDYRHPIGIAFS